MKRNIVIKLRIETSTGRRILAGILKKINDKDNCAINITGDIDTLQRFSGRADALIADSTADADIVKSLLESGKPVVLLNTWLTEEPLPNLGQVRTDDEAIGKKAADYFMSIGRFRSFAYMPTYIHKVWSKKRGQAFAQRLKQKGHECNIFSHDEKNTDAIGEWLKSLPKPTAVFCAWDGIAADVSNIARKAKIKIPSQMVLLGVDNDEFYCSSASPQMSSIEFDSEEEGSKAFELLLKIMASSKKKQLPTIYCGAVKRIVERDSTRPPVPTAYLIDRATKFISENACRNIKPNDVASYLGISRTLLDLRFRDMDMGTVGEIILKRKLSQLSTLLKKTNTPILKLTKECGFGSLNHAKSVFKKHFGMSMREWRKNKNSGDTFEKSSNST